MICCMNLPSGGSLLKKAEMAKLLSISVRKFDYCRAEGWVPEIKISERTIRFDPSEVLKVFGERFGRPAKEAK